MENVAGLVHKHKKTLEQLIEAFRIVGYNITTSVLDAVEFGTAQKRKRLFIIGTRDDIGKFVFPKPPMIKKSVFEAIGDLPDPDKEIGKSDITTVLNHIATWTNPTPDRIREITLTPRPNQWRGIQRLNWDKPSHTLTAHIAKDGREFLHPEVDRRITVREALRIMGIPDTFIIPEGITLRNQYMITGNGVAYPVAKLVADALYRYLAQYKEKKKNR